ALFSLFEYAKLRVCSSNCILSYHPLPYLFSYLLLRMDMTEIPKAYEPKEIEKKWYPIWEDSGYFTPKMDSDAQSFSMVIPPPNVTGYLHMGHALNHTLGDVLVRWRRMQGDKTLWLPGTDHAGIATQVVVEKQLTKAGSSRQALGR